MDPMTEYYYAKEREESTIERINDSYLEALNSLEQLESENAKLRAERDEWHRVAESKQDIIDHMRDTSSSNMRLRELCADMVKMLVLACWASVESDEEVSQCIYRAEALGIEVN